MKYSRALRRSAAMLGVTALFATAVSCGSGGSDTAKDDVSASPSAAAGDCPDVESGSQSEAVDVSGAFGKKQEVDFSTPLEAKDLQRTVVKEGSGDALESGTDVNALVSVFVGKDAKSLGAQQVTLTTGDDQMIKAFAAGIDCQTIGSRVVVASPASEMYGEQGNPQLGVSGDDTLVIVTDLIGEKKPLEPQEWKQDRADVTFGKDGKPTVKLPDTAPPKQLVLQVLEEGDGATVGKGDQVTLDYQGTSWNTGKVFDQSYGREPATFGTDQVVEGFGAALVGQKVGTKLVVSIPPENAYGPKGSGHELAGQTLVFVIDIQKTQG